MALIRFFKPTLRRKDMDAVLQTMVDEKIGPGERRKVFLSLLLGALSLKGGLCLRSHIDSIFMAFKALGLKEGDAVLISVLAPDVYKAAADRAGLKLILCDTDERSGTISTESIKEKITEDAKAIVLHEPVCQLPLNGEELKGFGLLVIEDISESFGSVLGDVKAGQVGDIVLMAFEEDNVISAAGGSAVLASNDVLVEELDKVARPFRQCIDLPDMNAALGITQISNTEWLLKRRSELYRSYSSELLKGGKKPFGIKDVEFVSNGHAFPVIVETRPDEAIAFANKNSVSCKRTFTKCLGSPWQDRFDLYPVSCAALSRSLSFPLYPFLQGKEIEQILRVLAHLP